MKLQSPKQKIEALGAGVFVRERNVESRLSEEDFHRAFSEPVIVWVTPGEYQEEKMDSLLDSVKKLHAIQRFRFPNVFVSARILDRISSEFPGSRIEGVKKKEPNQPPEPTRASAGLRIKPESRVAHL